MRGVFVRLPPKLRERAEKYSTERGLSLAALVRLALDEYLRARGY